MKKTSIFIASLALVMLAGCETKSEAWVDGFDFSKFSFQSYVYEVPGIVRVSSTSQLWPLKENRDENKTTYLLQFESMEDSYYLVYMNKGLKSKAETAEIENYGINVSFGEMMDYFDSDYDVIDGKAIRGYQCMVDDGTIEGDSKYFKTLAVSSLDNVEYEIEDKELALVVQKKKMTLAENSLDNISINTEISYFVRAGLKKTEEGLEKTILNKSAKEKEIDDLKGSVLIQAPFDFERSSYVCIGDLMSKINLVETFKDGNGCFSNRTKGYSSEGTLDYLTEEDDIYNLYTGHYKEFKDALSYTEGDDYSQTGYFDVDKVIEIVRQSLNK